MKVMRKQLRNKKSSKSDLIDLSNFTNLIGGTTTR